MEVIKAYNNKEDFYLSKVSNIFKYFYYEDEQLITSFNLIVYRNHFEINKLPNTENPNETIVTGKWKIPIQPLGLQVFL